MSRVRFFELERGKELEVCEREIGRRLAALGDKKTKVRLFKTSAGQIGYTLQVLALDGSKGTLDQVHRMVCEVIGYKRGRPASEPTRQVKCRIPESTYRRLVGEAKKCKKTPSTLVRDYVVKHVG